MKTQMADIYSIESNLLLTTTGLDGGVLAAAISFSLLPGPPGGLDDNGPQVLPGLVSSPSVAFKHKKCHYYLHF